MSDDPDRDARLLELEADNRRLRRLLDQRDAPSDLRHRLRSTLAVLRTIIRKSAETSRDLDDYTAHLEDRLDALARAQAAADQRGSVDLHTLIADELLHYNASEGDRVSLSGPVVDLRPRAGQLLALAIHELAVNSIEHGVLGGDQGQLDVAWAVSGQDADRTLALEWTEEGITGVGEPSRQGFGTEVLTRMLGYELKAETSLDFRPDGLRGRISLPLPAQIGQVTRE